MRELQPIEQTLPAPLEAGFVIRYRKDIKQLGISPDVIDGIRVWRVIWRPFLDTPEIFYRPDGTQGLRRKSDKVNTARYPIVNGITEEQAFRDAVRMAMIAYRRSPPEYMPIVNWEAIAKRKGQKLRDSFAKPGLNKSTKTKARELRAQGYTDRQVALQIGIDRSTAGRWRRDES